MSRIDDLECRVANLEKHLGIVDNQTVTFPMETPAPGRCTCGTAAYCLLHGGRGVYTGSDWPEGREPSR